MVVVAALEEALDPCISFKDLGKTFQPMQLPMNHQRPVSSYNVTTQVEDLGHDSLVFPTGWSVYHGSMKNSMTFGMVTT